MSDSRRQIEERARDHRTTLSLRIDVELRRNLEREAIHAAIAEAETGAFVSQTAMDTWISSWDTDSELPPPEPDTFTDLK